MTEKQMAMAQEALGRAQGGLSMGNYAAVYHGFMAKGIAQADIEPRENVLTYHAWRALGRQVCKGQHGVKLLTWLTTDRKTTEQDAETGETKDVIKTARRPQAATVFHISQTEPI